MGLKEERIKIKEVIESQRRDAISKFITKVLEPNADIGNCQVIIKKKTYEEIRQKYVLGDE